MSQSHVMSIEPGLPPDGAQGQFMGLDEKGNAFVLEWREDQKAFAGMGFAPNGNGRWPLAFITTGDMAGFIKRYGVLLNTGFEGSLR